MRHSINVDIFLYPIKNKVENKTDLTSVMYFTLLHNINFLCSFDKEKLHLIVKSNKMIHKTYHIIYTQYH